MNDNKILLVSDFVGVGKVALSAMSPILSTMKANISFLPTAVVSNNFDYGNASIADLTNFMQDSLNVWKELNLEFDTIVTGILMNPKQVEIIKEIINYQSKKPLIISDPIMGDHGKLYNGLSMELVRASQLVALKADIILPNLTEFAFILNEKYPNDSEINHDLIISWLEKARKKGIKSAIITSVKIGEKYYVYGYEDDEIFRVEIEYIPTEVGGAGDIFTSLFVGKYLQEKDLKASVSYAAKILTNIIKKEYKPTSSKKKIEVRIQNYLQDVYRSL
ncbi:pyridoxamine kinase [Campylobacter blaseri]|nr:PfkB family carbohydrate kinase [Campylobacter blaseri]QKF86789.1 pyridoxamine kinase [Campylobacter blaseri]